MRRLASRDPSSRVVGEKANDAGQSHLHLAGKWQSWDCSYFRVPKAHALPTSPGRRGQWGHKDALVKKRDAKELLEPQTAIS